MSACANITDCLRLQSLGLVRARRGAVWAGPAWHTGTTFAGLKPYRHFFPTTTIGAYRYDVIAERNSFVGTRRVFWAQSITKMRLRPELRPTPYWGSLQRSPDPVAGGGIWSRMGGSEGEGAHGILVDCENVATV